MSIDPNHLDMILKIQSNARSAPEGFDVVPILEIEIGRIAQGLFGQGWNPIDIRDYCHSVNRMLSPMLRKSQVDRSVTDSLLEAQYSLRPDDRSPGAHLKKLEERVRSWGEHYAFRFGIPMLDDAWGGLMPGELGVLVGAQGSMKTSLAIHGIMETLQEDPESTVLVFSLDMTDEEFAARFFLRDLGISLSELYGLMKHPTKEYAQAAQKFNDSTRGRMDILSNSYKGRWTIDGVEQQTGMRLPSLVVIDFLTCLKRRGQSDLDAVEEIMPRLQSLVQKLGIKMLLLSQMGRASKVDQLKGGTGGHSKGGGIVEELCHAEIELFKDRPAAPGGEQRIIATVTKTRRGQNGMSFDLAYRGRSMEFTGSALRVERERDQKTIFSCLDALRN